jgi:hypothetical protein
MFGRALQLSERRDGRARRAGKFMVNLEQHRFVRLHDQRSVSHLVPLLFIASLCIVAGTHVFHYLSSADIICAAPPHRFALHRRRRAPPR